MIKTQKTYLGYQTSIVRNGGLYIAGDPQVGNVLTASNAEAVQWMADGVDIASATALTYTVVTGDVGKRITARSTSGTIETSNALTALAAVTAPLVTLPPLVVGVPTVGQPLSINAATFSGSTATVERTIYGSSEPSSQILARGPLASTTYTPSATDMTRTFIVADQATNAAGTVRAISPRSIAVPIPSAAQLKAFSSTDSFAQGDQVLYAGGLYTFTAAHPAGNWTGNDVTYNGQNGDLPLNTVGFSKPQGVVSSWTAGTLATTNTTTPTQSRGFKMDAEAPFTQVRAALFTREPTPMRGFALSVASTETDSLTTLSNAIDPIVNGTAHSVIKGADPYGFARLTWSGAQRSPVQPGCGVTSPGTGYATNMSSVFSDWADCASVPVVTGRRPMLVGRLSRTVNINDANSNIANNALTGSYSRYLANDPTGRIQYHPLVGTNGDHVGDPTLPKTGGALYDATADSVWQNMAWIFQHNIPTRVMGGFGDSITEGYRVWQNVVLQLSTPQAPFYIANFGCSTNRSAQYQALLESQLRGENYLTDVIMPSFSPNEPNVITDAMADGYIAELGRMCALCAAYKKRLYIWTSYAALTSRFAGTSSVASINKINDWVRTEAAKPGATFQMIEIANGYDNSTMTMGGSDNTHPNATGVAYFNSRILPVVQKGI